MSNTGVRRGEVYWVDWNPARGSEQAGRRPALVIQTDAGNANPNYTKTIVAAISSASPRVLTHVEIKPSANNGLAKLSCVKCEQLVTITKDRLAGSIGTLDPDDMLRVDIALKRALALT